MKVAHAAQGSVVAAVLTVGNVDELRGWCPSIDEFADYEEGTHIVQVTHQFVALTPAQFDALFVVSAELSDSEFPKPLILTNIHEISPPL